MGFAIRILQTVPERMTPLTFGRFQERRMPQLVGRGGRGRGQKLSR